MNKSRDEYTSAKPVADQWFSVDPCEDSILMLREIHVDPYTVGDIWIVRGRDCDLVIDTGLGLVSPVPVVEAIAGKPVIAVVLNDSFDHAGGWHGFAERSCHPLDAAELEIFNVEDAGVGDYLTDAMLWALPRADYQLSDYTLTPAKATRLVDEGDEFDLGDRQLLVMHAPGRGPGGLAIWEQATGSLFTSDMLYDGDHGLAWPPDDAPAYCASLRRFRELPVKRVYPGHYGPMGRKRMLEVIDEQLADLEK